MRPTLRPCDCARIRGMISGVRTHWRRKGQETHVLAARLCDLFELVKHAPYDERLALEQGLLPRARVECDLAEVANLLVLGLDLGERAPARLADRLHQERLADAELERLVLGRELCDTKGSARHERTVPRERRPRASELGNARG